MAHSSNMIIVGAGLAGLITAWRCLDSNPDLRITIITAADKLAGNQIWSFNRDDILPELAEWVTPFIKRESPRYDVKFPGKNRTLNIPYCYSDFQTLLACVQPFLDNGRLTVKFNSRVTDLNLQSVTLENGETLGAHYVVDARGFKPRCGVVYAYKQIMGLVIRTKQAHNIANPIVMDACPVGKFAEQVDGFQYIYCLPISDDEILVEAICYADNQAQDEAAASARIDAYIKAQNWDVVETGYEEIGILPVTLASDMDPDSIDINETSQASKVGMRCGYYHAFTGYSFAEVLKSALVIDEYIQADGENYAHGAAREMNQHEIDHFREEKFLRLFNRRMFCGIAPEQRYKVFTHIYDQPEDFITRFYRGRMQRNDKLKLLGLKSPVSIFKTLKYAKDGSVMG